MKENKMVWVMSMVVLALLFSCGKTNKIESLVKEEMKKTLLKPESYDPIETKTDSAFAPMDDPALYKDIVELTEVAVVVSEYEEKAKRAKSYMLIYDHPYMSSYDRNEYQEKKEEYEGYISQRDEAAKRAEELRNSIRERLMKKPVFIGFKAYHRYRAQNNAGNTVIDGSVYLIDKDCSRVLGEYKAEDYSQYVEIVKKLKEQMTGQE